MSSSKLNCLRCKKTSQSQLLSLICDHILCLPCSQSLKTIQPQSTIQNKYKICCPLCKKSTLTYDLKNLLLKNASENLMMFENIENTELNQSSIADDYRQRPSSQHHNFKQMSYTQRVNNLSRKESRTPDVGYEWKENRNNRGNYESNRMSKNGKNDQDYSSICKQHSENLIFFCEVQKKLLCMQCMYKHTKQHKNHKVLSIKNSISIIGKENMMYKDQTKRKMDELQQYIKITHHNKTILEQKFRLSLEVISDQFASIQLMLKTRQSLLKQTLKNIFLYKQKQFTTEIADLTHLQNCLKQYMNFDLENTSAEIYFYHAYSLLRQAMSKLNLKVHPISPSSISLIQRSNPQQLKQAIDRVFILPRDRKTESRPQSRIDSAHPNKHSSVLNQELKNAKKKLEKLEKLQKGEKGGNYLNNYMSNYSRQKERQRKSVQVENQKKIGNKAITPTRMSSKMKHKK